MYSLASRSPRCNATRRNVPQVNTCCTDLVEAQYICPQTTGPLRIFTGRTELQILRILTDSPSSTDGDESVNDSVSDPLGRESNTGATAAEYSSEEETSAAPCRNGSHQRWAADITPMYRKPPIKSSMNGAVL